VFSIIKPTALNTGVFYSVDEALPHLIEGDPVRLRQVLINLIGNTVQNTEEGFVRLDIYLLQTLEDELEIEFVITNSSKERNKKQ